MNKKSVVKTLAPRTDPAKGGTDRSSLIRGGGKKIGMGYMVSNLPEKVGSTTHSSRYKPMGRTKIYDT